MTRYTLLKELSKHIHPTVWQAIPKYNNAELSALVAYYQYKPVV